ncbi:ATP-binding protein [Amycolatopsis roodepoortensis]|uniref:SpoVK/Ycf46/Vps4 family AAA+-type ATPase n=1 Tax=Amycolatopsis roodepoortensis TaxID=700274 RepID=A0ABR9LGD0_9PSEU|nr:ATP-binding protein [Amycolatopsis roodepoortensis]MBE1579714.1 SpoVK/Ycf46/Vps4 family AAA+-type ATPase [Amycolatopsis roodepoortensis]
MTRDDKADPDDGFVEVIAREVEADPGNLALREDFVTLLLEREPERAATELAAFEAHGGDPGRVRLLRARLMATRLRASNPVPAPADEDRQESAVSASLWDAERPKVTLDDVAGLAEVKQHLNTAFLAPLRNPELAAAFGQKPGGSLLMYGPPGCGKTFIARAIAGDLGASFLHVTLADLLSKWIGESEKAIQSVFRHARAATPCVIFFDEFDALGGRRTSGGGGSHAMRMLVTQLLEELDGMAGTNDGVYFLAATNRPWDIDSALRRPGRIDKTVLVLPPDAVARAAIVQGALAGKPAADVDAVAVAAATEGFSGADLSHLTTTVLQKAMVESMSRNELVPVTTEGLLAAVGGIIPSTTSWFDQVAPVLEYGVDDGTFDQLRAYRVKRGMR